MQLGGNLTVRSSNFDNNHADFDGGAVYTSASNVLIENSEFKNNGVELFDGGALYIDWGNLESKSNKFVKNSASEGGAIYLFDSYYAITGSTFTDNGEAICSYFDYDGSYQKNNNLGKDKVVLGKTYYGTSVDFEGKQIVLNPLKIEGSPNDSYFNLAEQGLVTPVKDQGNKGACWAFGTAGALESAFLIATNITLDISENNIYTSGLRYSRYGETNTFDSSNFYMGSGYLLGWLGVVSAQNVELPRAVELEDSYFTGCRC